MSGQLARGQVPADLTCCIEDIYPSHTAWEEGLRAVEAGLPDLSAYRGRLGESAAELLAFLTLRSRFAETFDRVAAYAELRFDADGVSAANQAIYDRFTALSARVGETLTFAVNELLGLPEGTIARFIAEEPALGVYRPQMEELARRRPHVLAPQSERVLAALEESLELPFNVWQRVTAADLACPSIPDGQGGSVAVTLARHYSGLSRSADREERRLAFLSLAEGLSAHQHTLAATLASQIKRNVTLARLRGYGSAVEMMLAREDIAMTVYRNILTTVHDGMAPPMRKLVELRRRVLGLGDVHHYDLFAPLDPGFNPKASYAEASVAIREGLRVLGPAYASIIARAMDERWVDRADNVGKRSGAWTLPVHGVHPYVFLTWQDNWRTALILAHELGHAAQGELTARHQVIDNAWSMAGGPVMGEQPSMFFVEAPSTSAEVLVGRHLLTSIADPRLHRYVLEQYLQTFIHNMVTHMLEAHFLQRLFDLAESGEPITTSTIMHMQAKVFAQFYGDAVVPDEATNTYWMQQPHFYMGLYPYTYSAGLAVGYNVVEAIAANEPGALERWLQVLQAGSTLTPLGLARLAGVDMESPIPIQRTVAYFGRLVDELVSAYA